MKIKIGDRIKFTVATRQGLQSATRKVVGFMDDNPCVRFRGYSEFIVYRKEVTKVLNDE